MDVGVISLLFEYYQKSLRFAERLMDVFKSCHLRPKDDQKVYDYSQNPFLKTEHHTKNYKFI